MQLQADDGTPLKAKEGVVIDESGRPLGKAAQFKTIRVGQLSWPAVVIGLAGFALLVPILITAGFALAAIVGIILTVIVINRKLSQLFRSNR
jgi:hypothetical protein